MEKAIAILIVLVWFIVALIIVLSLTLWRERVSRQTIVELSKEYEARMESMVEGQEILISQIQPHFLYNVLNTIKYLCRRNPDEALVAIDRLSSFLRKSMDAFSAKECIPFAQEMEIVDNYVYLEKRRFGDKVEVNYELNSVDFKVPSLSVQTMVENAIKHGVTKKLGGGQVWISTYDDEDSHVVEIRDNGVGFYVDEKKDDGKSHIGIKNTAKRIETMAKGTFHIESEIGVMTKVVMTIPKEI